MRLLLIVYILSLLFCKFFDLGLARYFFLSNDVAYSLFKIGLALIFETSFCLGDILNQNAQHRVLIDTSKATAWF